MSKVGKLTTSRSERFLYDYNHVQTRTEESSELREDDVWSMVNDSQPMVNGSYEEWTPRASHQPRPRVDRHIGGLSLAFDDDSGNTISSSRIIHQFHSQDSPRGRHMAASAPVNVPDWSKVDRVDSVESMHDSDDVEESEHEMVPPHEYLAQQYQKMAATSVLVGVGRTLKGRDLSRVRDAVWSQTGFDG